MSQKVTKYENGTAKNQLTDVGKEGVVFWCLSEFIEGCVSTVLVHKTVTFTTGSRKYDIT